MPDDKLLERHALRLLPHELVSDRNATEPASRGRSLDRRLIEGVVQDLLGSEAAAEEFESPLDRHPGHVREYLVDADPDARVEARTIRTPRGEAKARVARTRVDLGAVHEDGRVSAPPAGLGAPLVVLRYRAGLDVIGKEAVVDAHVDFGHGLFDVTVGRGHSERREASSK